MTNTTQSERQSRYWPITKLIDIITRTRAGHKSQPPDTELSYSDALHILASERRRYILEFFDIHQTEMVSLSELTEFVAARENDCPVSEVSSTQCNRAYISIHQQHAPKMDRFDYLDYDHGGGTVRASPRLSELWRAYRAFRQELTG